MVAAFAVFGAMLALDDPADAGKLTLTDQELCLHLTSIGRKLMGEVAEARFRSLCGALGLEGAIV